MGVTRIGRLVIDGDVVSVERWEQRGREVTITGAINGNGDVQAAGWAARQVAGVWNPQEPVQPILWPFHSHLDGWYSIASSTVTPTDAHDVWEWEITARLVATAERASYEIHSRGGAVDNDQSIAPPSLPASIWFPPCATWTIDWGRGIDRTEVTAETRDLDSGHTIPGGNNTGSAWYNTVARAFVLPADAYVGAATIEVQRNGVWGPVVGRQLGAVPQSWRLTNGHVRIWWDSPTNRLLIERWSPAGSGSWTSVGRQFSLAHGTGYISLQPPIGFTVIWNTPNLVAIELLTGNSTLGQVRLAVSLRRGQPCGSVVAKARQSVRWGVTINPVAAAVDYADYIVNGETRGWRQTGGNPRWGLAFPRAMTSLVDDRTILSDNAMQTFAFGLGLGTSDGTAAGAINRFFAQPFVGVEVVPQ